MDPVVSAFMQRIVWSLTSALVWLMINAVVGLKFELALLDGTHRIGTILFYCWFFGSLFALMKLFKRWWKQHL
jgi:ABC-type long-subunit fatty acid transport system fused permease/ATPase subunit